MILQTETAGALKRKDQVKRMVIDCDIHPEPSKPEDLYPYIPERWLEHHKTIGLRAYHGYSIGLPFPPASPLASRDDSWGPEGNVPGSDLGMLQKQFLDPLNVEYGVLNSLYPAGMQLNEQYGAALARAINDWQLECWLKKDARLRASIVVPYENPDLAVKEIERLGNHPGFVQVLFLSKTKEPIGRSKYWKIYEAAEAYHLPIGIHVINVGMNPNTSSGWVSYYLEIHTSLAPATQVQLVSLICEGVFEQFPKLKTVFIESGFAWLPSVMWRLDNQWKRLGKEIPHVQRLPSETILEHVRFSTQPMEEPTNPKHLLQLFEHMGADNMLLFASDYPHWDYDDPFKMFQTKVPEHMKQNIVYNNAISLYDFKKGEK